MGGTSSAYVSAEVPTPKHAAGPNFAIQTPKSWNMGLGRFILVFLLLQALGLEGSHVPTFWLLLYCFDFYFSKALYKGSMHPHNVDYLWFLW